MRSTEVSPPPTTNNFLFRNVSGFIRLISNERINLPVNDLYFDGIGFGMECNPEQMPTFLDLRYCSHNREKSESD